MTEGNKNRQRQTEAIMHKKDKKNQECLGRLRLVDFRSFPSFFSHIERSSDHGDQLLLSPALVQPARGGRRTKGLPDTIDGAEARTTAFSVNRPHESISNYLSKHQDEKKCQPNRIAGALPSHQIGQTNTHTWYTTKQKEEQQARHHVSHPLLQLDSFTLRLARCLSPCLSSLLYTYETNCWLETKSRTSSRAKIKNAPSG